MISRFLLVVVFLGLIILRFAHIVYLNIFTHSLPYGVYVRINGIPKAGDFAASCLTSDVARYGIDRGYLAEGNCQTGTVLVLKIIRGMPGDRFFLKNGSLEINGRSYPIKDRDSLDRPLKVFYQKNEGVLDRGEYILLSDFAKNSWDSRYWGPVSIQFLLKPLWLFEQFK